VLLRHSVELEHFTEPFVRDPMINDIVRKIRLTDGVPDDKPLGARVVIRTKQGGEYETEVTTPKGHGSLTPLSKAEERQKFLDQAAFCETIPARNAEDALSVLDRVEEVDDIADFVKLLTPENV
jgi:2-methylcitrate dehydratase PrpD